MAEFAAKKNLNSEKENGFQRNFVIGVHFGREHNDMKYSNRLSPTKCLLI